LIENITNTLPKFKGYKQDEKKCFIFYDVTECENIHLMKEIRWILWNQLPQEYLDMEWGQWNLYKKKKKKWIILKIFLFFFFE